MTDRMSHLSVPSPLEDEMSDWEDDVQPQPGSPRPYDGPDEVAPGDDDEDDDDDDSEASDTGAFVEEDEPKRLSLLNLTKSFERSTRSGGELFERVQIEPHGVRRKRKKTLWYRVSHKMSDKRVYVPLLTVLWLTPFMTWDSRLLRLFYAVVSLALGMWKGPMILVSIIDRQRRRTLQAQKPKRIVLIRHAESLGNTDLSAYARIPDNAIPLTEKGHKQAYLAGKRLKEIVRDETVRFFVSPYKRSRETFEGMLDGSGLSPDKYTVREDPRIREQDFGNWQHDSGLIKRSMKERRAFGVFYYRMPFGESGADVYDRVSSFWSSLQREFEFRHCLTNFVIVTHGITARLLLTRYFRWTVQEFSSLWNLENTQMIVMELQKNGKYKLKTPLKRNPLRRTPTGWVRSRNDYFRAGTYIEKGGGRDIVVPSTRTPVASDDDDNLSGGGGGDTADTISATPDPIDLVDDTADRSDHPSAPPAVVIDGVMDRDDTIVLSTKKDQ